MQTIGTLAILRRYPVKSMSGEDLDRVHVAFTGVTGDRVYAFVNDLKTAEKKNFPWHSAREQHDLLLYRPRFRAALDVNIHYPAASAFAVEVTTPSGRTTSIDDPALARELAERAGYPVTIRFSEKGMHDARPLALFSLDTLAALGKEAGRELDSRRFRANFYVRWKSAEPFYEDTLVGRRLKIGDSLEIAIVKKDPRCIIINLDPTDAEHHPEVLKTVAKGHKGCVGVYAAVLREGVVAAGDEIQLLD